MLLIDIQEELRKSQIWERCLGINIKLGMEIEGVPSTYLVLSRFVASVAKLTFALN